MGQFLDKTGLQTVLQHIKDTYAKKPVAISDIDGLADQLAAGKFQATVVESLPTEGTNGTIYLVAASKTGENNNYAEYIWVGDKFEKLGEAAVDLAAYSTTDEMNTAISTAIGNILGRRYMGVAVPATNPTADDKIFYIAGTQGNYTNFTSSKIGQAFDSNGNPIPLAVKSGEIAIFTYSSAQNEQGWTKTTLYTADIDSAIPVETVQDTINKVLNDSDDSGTDDSGSSEAPGGNTPVQS